MRQESGFSLVEVVIVMVLAGLLITASVVYALPWFGREDDQLAARRDDDRALDDVAQLAQIAGPGMTLEQPARRR